MAHGKRFRMQHQKVQRDHLYAPAEAVALIKETASAKFDETVELHVLLGVNVRHADEQLRGTLALPHGLGKEVTIAVFAQRARLHRKHREHEISDRRVEGVEIELGDGSLGIGSLRDQPTP